MDEAILDVVLQVRIAAHCSSIRPHNLAFSVARSPNQGVFRWVLPRRCSIRRSPCGNSEAIVGVGNGGAFTKFATRTIYSNITLRLTTYNYRIIA